jgi:hypothetical protein
MLQKRSKVRDISGKVFPIEATTLKDAFERAVKKAGLRRFPFPRFKAYLCDPPRPEWCRPICSKTVDGTPKH